MELTALTEDLLLEVEVRLNNDPIVALDAKWHRAILTLTCDSESRSFSVSQGHVKLIDNGDGEGMCRLPRIHISGSAERWQPILSGLHGGLHRAFRHRLLAFDGDAVAMMSLWKTVWRLGEALHLASVES